MNFIKSLQSKLIGLISAITRYPLTVFFLLAAAFVNAMSVQDYFESHLQYLFTFLIGALLSTVAQQVYERFFQESIKRLLLYAGAILLTVGYYFAIQSTSVLDTEMSIKTAVMIFALLMVFIWVPSVKSKITFNETFMATFKACFTTLLFTVIIYIGLNAILFAVDHLLVTLNPNIYGHILNIIFTLFFTLLFLSLIPKYSGKAKSGNEQQVKKATECPRVLDVLISYVIIPLTGVYTFVLLAYVLLNVRGEFWTNNLLEPMLVSYAITVILVYILSSSLENTIAAVFRKVFPKILIPIVLFQTVASILKIGEIGVTYGRYYVIMFGLFAVIAGFIFSIFSIRRNGWIAAVLIVFSMISIVPPVDAFTTSRSSQVKLLEQTLTQNGMLEKGSIHPNSEISTKDKQKITRAVDYLSNMEYTKQIDWLPDDLNGINKFEQAFGFPKTYYEEGEVSDHGRSAYFDSSQNLSLNIEGYDRMNHLYINNDRNNIENNALITIEINGSNYRLEREVNREEMYLVFVADDGQELMKFDLKKAFEEILDASEQGELDIEHATVTVENEAVRMSIVANSVDFYGERYSGDVFVFIDVK